MTNLAPVLTAVDQVPIHAQCILIIDDDPFARRILRLLFESEGYVCKEAENGRRGLAMFEQHRPDLIITDYMMPVLTGIEFLERLGKKQQRYVPPVIVATGCLNHDIKIRALQSGARAVLAKPYDIGEIRALANWLLNAESSIPLTTHSAMQYQ